MRNAVQILNLVGVLALAALCCAQWSANRRLNLQAEMLERTRLDLVAKIAEQEKTIAGQRADLDDFRQRLTLSETALKESREKFLAIESERNQLLAERDQLKSALDKWMAAVTERDAALKQAGEQIQKLTGDRDDAIAKFNDLANKYNALVKQIGGENKQ